MLKWKKFGRSIEIAGSDVNTTNTYSARGKLGDYTIESRRKLIPHANGIGYWVHTSYFLITGGKEKEYRRLMDAKAAAEQMEEARK